MIKKIIERCKKLFKSTEMKNKKCPDKVCKSFSTFVIEDEKCKGCSEPCVKVCEEMGIGSISATDKGIFRVVSTPNGEPPAQCIGCAVCAAVCPTNAISVVDRDGQREIWGKKFKLLKCEKCGKEFATEEHLKFAFSRAGVNMEKVLCERCRRKSSADKIKNAFVNVGL
jgi:ferredoxin